jgi:hypothetical protein
MARYNIALAALLASKAFAAEVSINSDGAMDRSLFSKVRHLGFAHALSSLVFVLLIDVRCFSFSHNIRSQVW